MAAALVAAATVAASFVLLVAPSTAEPGIDNGEIVRVGTFDRIPQVAIDTFGDIIVPRRFFERVDDMQRNQYPEVMVSGTMLLAAEARQVWQFYPFTDFSRRTAILVRDLDTLEVLHTEVLDAILARGAQVTGGGDWMHAFDGGRRLFLIEDSRPVVIAYDLRTFKRTHHPIGLPLGVNSLPTSVQTKGGLTYDPVSKGLLVLSGGVAAMNVANTNTVVTRLDLESGETRFHYVRSCNGPLPPTDQSQTYGLHMITSEDSIFLPCSRAGNVGAVVRLSRDWMTATAPIVDEDVDVGPVYLETALADQAGGRLFLVTILGEVWVYDLRSASFVGVVAAHAEATSNVNVGYGLDPATGRLFFQSATHGVGVVEGRFFPIPQARTLATPEAMARGQERIMGDARTGRFFVLPGISSQKAHRYTVYRAGVAPLPPAPPDPDRSTADVDEKAGVTESRYNANGSGYGLRVLLARGVSTAAPAPTLGVLAPTAQAIDDYVNSKCGFTDRELVAGRVAKAEYDHGSTAASAIAVDVDDRTAVDLESPSRCDLVSPGRFQGFFATEPTKTALAPHDKGPGWEHEPASCTSSEGGKAQDGAPDDGTQRPLGTSSVACPVPGGELHAYAEADLRGGVDVGKAWARTIVRRTPKGVESVVESRAQDIDIAEGAIRIREVGSKATSRANGRPQRDDMSTHVTYLKGVTLAGNTLCDEKCDTGQVVELLNTAVGGRAQFRVASGIDHELRRGSPKGALTAVQKSTERQASDRALVGDFTVEVPGLEMTVYNDNKEWGRARQVYQFAGVASASNYNIVVQPSASGFDDADAGGGADDGDDEDEIEDEFLPTGGEGDGPVPGVTELADGSPISALGGGDSEGGLAAAVRRAAVALARGVRLFFTDPRHGLLLLTAWAMFGLPPVLARRRRLLVDVRAE